MRNFIKNFVVIIIFSLSQGIFAQNCNWATAIGDAGGDAATQLVALPNGALVGGIFQQQINLAGTQYSSTGAFDIFLCWYNNNKQPVQALCLGNVGNNELSSLVADSLGNVYIAGTFSGQLAIGGFNLQSSSRSHFIAKISPQGQVLWAELLKGKGVNDVLDMQLSLDGQELWLCGDYNDSLQYQNQFLFDNNFYNLFILKLRSSDGQAYWMQDSPRAKWAKAWSLAIMPDGTAWVAGEFLDSLYMPDATYFYSYLHSDVLFAHIDGNGQWLKSKRWGGVYNDRPKKLRLAPDRQTLWMSGDFVAVLRIDQFQLITARRYYDVFWVKINAAGEALAVGQSNTVANSYLYDMAFFNNELLIGGYFQDSLQGASAMHYTRGGFDLFWFNIDTATALLQNSQVLGSLGNDQLNAFAAMPGELWAAGTFQQTMPWTSNISLSANGFSDAWLACLPLVTASGLAPFSVPTLLSVKIIPNPSSDSFRIELPEAMPLRWELYALNGKRVLSGTTEIVTATDLTAGIYSLNVFTEKGMGVAKIVKK